MSQMRCDFCGELFRDGEDVEAKVITKFKTLKSDRIYAIEKPSECLGLRHYPDCQFNKDKEN